MNKPSEIISSLPLFSPQWNRKYFRYVPPVFITLILIAGYFSFGMLDDFRNIFAAVGTSIGVELLLSRLILKQKKNLASAYITGISVSILIRSTLAWPYMITAALSILTKYVLRYRGHHIWNPSNFGISWMLFTAPFCVAGLSIQWGNNLVPMAVIWMLGIFIVWKAKRLHVTATYVAAYIFFALVRSWITDTQFLTELAPLTGPMYQLFIFFMITDPPTGVSTRRGRIVVAFVIAFVEFILRLNSVIYAPFYALFVVGPAAKFLDLYFTSKQNIVQGDSHNAGK